MWPARSSRYTRKISIIKGIRTTRARMNHNMKSRVTRAIILRCTKVRLLKRRADEHENRSGNVRLKRAYELAARADGIRILVDRS